MAAIVLAGGVGKRLGEWKPFALLRGRPLIVWVLERLQGAGFGAEDTFVVTAPQRQKEFASLPAKVVADIYEGCGPLAGLHAGLSAAGEGFHFVTSCDQPFIEPALVRYLLQRAMERTEERLDALIPVTAEREQVLCAVYRHRVAEIAERLLQRGERRLRELLRHIKWQPVSEEDLRPFGDPQRLFFNINTAEDLELAHQLLTR